MRFLTDRKRATGLGSGREGTHHHWQMMVSSILLVPLVPILVILFGAALGGTHAEVLAFFSRPIPAILMALSLIVVVQHLMREAHAAIEDYIHGTAGKLTLIATTAFAYTMIAAGLFAIARIAL
ncbi:succinate dehydrogenase, hydrophobic membrane anchor protein [Tateyamaria omphalii]|uniref:Succinate dehydrogenase hydrophobic membrane anchor subunit n=1 Tax=Tateyamaria omphalii TaxID=299262 RepID=A0A1P8MQU5_9RHOB|nr:succinate dehydrogenase, hydrophobic membrane anchor protein [Tateyamaria omphalii]APX10446.1 succinate dehydrogenase, hydrophobic membrane anchor protein [Tateyamaria omphalii]